MKKKNKTFVYIDYNSATYETYEEAEEALKLMKTKIIKRKEEIISENITIHINTINIMDQRKYYHFKITSTKNI